MGMFLLVLGLFPVVALVGLQAYPQLFPHLAWVPAQLWLSYYTACVITFIAGSHWGMILVYSGENWRLVASNVLALLGCVALGFVFPWQFYTYIVTLLLLLVMDWGFFCRAEISARYWLIRLLVTIIYVVLLGQSIYLGST